MSVPHPENHMVTMRVRKQRRAIEPWRHAQSNACMPCARRERPLLPTDQPSAMPNGCGLGQLLRGDSVFRTSFEKVPGGLAARICRVQVHAHARTCTPTPPHTRARAPEHARTHKARANTHHAHAHHARMHTRGHNSRSRTRTHARTHTHTHTHAHTHARTHALSLPRVKVPSLAGVRDLGPWRNRWFTGPVQISIGHYDSINRAIRRSLIVPR
jgi:hypothetical protein